MKLTITNDGPVQLPVSSEKGGAWADILPPGVAYQMDRAQPDDIVSIGDNPSFSEEFKQAIQGMFKGVVDVLTFWKDRARTFDTENDKAVVTVTLTNNGDKGVRVILGDPTNDYTLGPGETKSAEAETYIELRELGA